LDFTTKTPCPKIAVNNFVQEWSSQFGGGKYYKAFQCLTLIGSTGPKGGMRGKNIPHQYFGWKNYLEMWEP